MRMDCSEYRVRKLKKAVMSIEFVSLQKLLRV